MLFPIFQGCECSETVLIKCLACESKVFPSYAIHNVFNSSIKKSLIAKRTVSLANVLPKLFKSHVGTFSPEVDIKSIMVLYSAPQLLQPLPAVSVINTTPVAPANITSLLDQFTNIPNDYAKLTFSNMWF